MAADLKIPTSLAEATTVLEIANDLIVRADEILAELRTGNPGRDVPAELWIDGDTATLSWSEKDGDYDYPGIEEFEGSFPAAVLLMSTAERKKWAKNEIAERERKRQEESAAYNKQRAAEAERHERDLLKSLKAKYEP